MLRKKFGRGRLGWRNEGVRRRGSQEVDTYLQMAVLPPPRRRFSADKNDGSGT